MKIHVMSDLHLEMRSWKQFVQQVLPGGDVLILPGDILYLKFLDQVRPVFEAFCEKYKKVFYVPGNHEYYKSHVADGQLILKAAAEGLQNFTVLRTGDVVEFDGRRFIGDTMWFKDHPMNVMYQDALNDFDQIKGFVPWVYDENTKFLKFLEQELKKDDVVVTHHLPTTLSTPDRFRGNEIDRFFLCDVSRLIADRQPALWLHGHTHDFCDYKVGDTRVYCNPLGYPREVANVHWKDQIEIQL